MNIGDTIAVGSAVFLLSFAVLSGGGYFGTGMRERQGERDIRRSRSLRVVISACLAIVAIVWTAWKS
jgi:hypothetical protein